MDEIKDTMIDFVDLALPSGTRWAIDYLKDKEGNILYLPYNEAAKLCIPTKEQFYELTNNCRIIQDNISDENRGCRILGTNGEYVHYHEDFYIEAGKKLRALFPESWLKDDEEDCIEKTVAHYYEEYYISHEYMGLKYPVILVCTPK